MISTKYLTHYPANRIRNKSYRRRKQDMTKKRKRSESHQASQDSAVKPNKKKNTTDRRKLSYIEMLPKKILIYEIGPRLSLRDASQFCQANSFFYNALNRPSYWRTRIENDFQVPNALANSTQVPKAVYQRLHALKTSPISRGLLKRIRYNYLDVKQDYPPLFHHAVSEKMLSSIEPWMQKWVLQFWLNSAARLGNEELVQWLMDEARGDIQCKPDEDTLGKAAQSGNLSLVEWLMDEARDDMQCKPDEDTLGKAAQSGNLSLVEWLMDEARGDMQRKPDNETLNNAAKSGNFALVEWLIDEARGDMQCELGKEAIIRAIELGLSLAPSLVERMESGLVENEDLELEISKESLYGAARSGNLSLVQWLMNDWDVTLSKDILPKAARSGNLSLVQWLMENYAKYDYQADDDDIDFCRPRTEVLNSAARSGNLSLVQWLMENYAKYDYQADDDEFDDDIDLCRSRTEVLNSAARSGNLLLVQWLMSEVSGERQCTPGKFTFRNAARSGNLALVQWLTPFALFAPLVDEDGCLIEYSDDDNDYYPSHLTGLKAAIASGNLPLVQWLMHEDRGDMQCKPDDDALTTAIFKKHFLIVQWLMYKNRDEKYEMKCLL